MEFKANFIKQVKKLLVNRPSRIKLNVSIKEIMKIVEIGTEINGFALFEHKDFRVLEDFATEHFGKDFLISKIDFTNRFTAASSVANEKSARQGVFESMLNVAAMDNALYFKDGTLVKLNLGIVSSLSPEQVQNLDVSKIKKLCVLENGVPLINLDKVLKDLPQEYQDIIFIYRGHGQNEAIVKDLIRSLNDEALVLLFFDYDIPGLKMATMFKALHDNSKVLIPTENSVIERLRSNKSELFRAQALTQSEYLMFKDKSAQGDRVSKEILYLQDKHLSLTQEAIIANGKELTTI